MAPQALILVAEEGSEEMETVTPYDVFIRAGFETTLTFVPSALSSSSVSEKPLAKLSRGLKMQTDTALAKLDQQKLWDVLVIPGGGPGAKTLSESNEVQKLIRHHYESKKVVGMICAGSLAAKTSGIGKGGRITSHPSVKDQLEEDYEYSEDRVVVDKNLVTSRGPGTALLFALTLVEEVAGKAKRDEVAGPMVPSEKL